MASERLEMEIVGKNSTAKGWDKVESEAKRRAKKIRDGINRDGGLVGNAGGSGSGGKGGFFSNIRKGFQTGQGQGLGGMLPGGGLGGMGAVAMGAAGIGAVVAGVAKLAAVANNYANAMASMADNSGISVKSAQNLVYAGKAYDVSAEQIESALGRIATAQSKASRDDTTQKSLERLNIPLKEFMNMSPDQAYARLGKALKETGDRASVMEIVGKSGMKQIAFMKEMAGGIKDVGLASTQNVEAVDSFFDSVSQGIMKMKAGVTNKVGQALRGDINAFMGGPEQEKQQTAKEQVEAQNEQFRKERETAEALKLTAERKGMRDKIEEKKEQAEAGDDEIIARQDRVDDAEKELNDKKGRGHLERNAMAWAGLQDMTAEQQAADDLKRGFNRGYDKQQSHAERDAKRMERRMKAREEMINNKNLKGPWIEKMRKVFNKAHDMAGKRDFVEDYNKVIATMSKEQRDLLRSIQKDTKALQKLDAAFTMGGAQEAGG
jgi:hypothetical protein